MEMAGRQWILSSQPFWIQYYDPVNHTISALAYLNVATGVIVYTASDLLRRHEVDMFVDLCEYENFATAKHL